MGFAITTAQRYNDIDHTGQELRGDLFPFKSPTCSLWTRSMSQWIFWLNIGGRESPQGQLWTKHILLVRVERKQYTEHLANRYWLEGIDLRKRLLTMEPSFLLSLFSSAVWSMFCLVKPQVLHLRLKLEFEEEFVKVNPLFRFAFTKYSRGNVRLADAALMFVLWPMLKQVQLLCWSTLCCSNCLIRCVSNRWCADGLAPNEQEGNVLLTRGWTTVHGSASGKVQPSPLEMFCSYLVINQSSGQMTILTEDSQRNSNGSIKVHLDISVPTTLVILTEAASLA